MTSAPHVARVALNTPLDRAFDYAIPAALTERIQVGSRVRVPFGPRALTGVVVAQPARPHVRRVREVMASVDEQPIYTPELLALGRWIAERYVCSWGEALAAMAPPVTGKRGVAMTSDASFAPDAVEWPQRVNASAQQATSGLIETMLRQKTGGTGVVRLAATIRPWEWLDDIVALGLRTARPILVLVPELQHVEFLRARWGHLLGARAIFLHHASKPSARREAWGRMLAGRVPLVVGTRLAVFAPLAACGLVICMDEHDPSYKQDDVPHYHAREVLLERARRWRAACLLVSATPSLECWQMVQQHRATSLPVDDATPKPARIHVVDLRAHQGSRGKGWPLIAPPLERALETTLQQGGRALLWLNRSGFATRVQCQQCGHVMQCERCAVPLTFFSRKRLLRCRYCAAAIPAPERCPQCTKGYLQYRGRGVEKVASEVARRWPTARLYLYEREPATRGQPQRHLDEESWDVLVATEAALHGWPLPPVQLLGAVVADAGLSLPDFRAAEHLWHRLWRSVQCVSWHTADHERVLIVQSMNPDQPVLQCFARGDIAAFYRQELALRRRHHLPPLTHLAQLVIRGRRAEATEARAKTLAHALTDHAGRSRIALLGPAPLHPLKQRGRYCWQLILKGRSLPTLLRRLRNVLEDGRRWYGQPLTVDVDPQ